MVTEVEEVVDVLLDLAEHNKIKDEVEMICPNPKCGRNNGSIVRKNVDEDYSVFVMTCCGVIITVCRE